MSCYPSPWAEAIKALALGELGFTACGIARAEPVEPAAVERYDRWIASGHHGDMTWASRNREVRNDPRLLLPGAQSIIMVALNYLPATRQPAGAARVALYAYGRDYHRVMRARLRRLAAHVEELTGGATRACVDSAPLRERYWAVKAGLGFIGLNNTLIIPGRGSFHVLGAVLTTAAIEADEPCTDTCGECGACIKACPGGALNRDGDAADASRCLSALTIENHDEQLPPELARRLDGRVAGCDECQLCCPHNASAVPTTVADFAPREAVMRLTPRAIAEMTAEQFDNEFAGSALRRVTLATLKRNAAEGLHN